MYDILSCVVTVIREVVLRVTKNKYISDNTHTSSAVYINNKCNTNTVLSQEAFLLRTKRGPYCCLSGRAILKVRKPVIAVKHL